MRAMLLSVLVMAAPGAGLGQSCKLTWPDAGIAIPGQVATFIAAECRAARGSAEETEAECIRAEGFGYRAQITMLSDPAIGDAAAARYRACRGGLGSLGGKFHRRRADCMGGVFGIAWRYEFTRETSVRTGRPVDFAAADAATIRGGL